MNRPTRRAAFLERHAPKTPEGRARRQALRASRALWARIHPPAMAIPRGRS